VASVESVSIVGVSYVEDSFCCCCVVCFVEIVGISGVSYGVGVLSGITGVS